MSILDEENGLGDLGISVEEEEQVKEKPPLSKADQKLADDLAGIYGVIAMTLGGIGAAKSDPGLTKTAELIAAKAGAISEAWLELANTNPSVKRTLKNLTAGTMVGGLVLLHIICLAPLLADRGIIPENLAMMATIV